MNMLQRTQASTTQEAQEIIRRLDEVASRVAAALAVHNEAQQKARDAEKELSSLESQVIFEESLNPNGKLKGVATTSKLYGHALESIVALAKQPHGPLYHKAIEAHNATIAAENAATELAQAQTIFTALKHIADLKAQILAAGG